MVALLLLFLGAGVLAGQFRGLFNGSIAYAPALLFLLGLGIYHYRGRYQARGILLSAALLFTVSLAFRSVDLAVCESLVLGTHFMWHLLNGLVLTMVLRGLVLNMEATRQPARVSAGVGTE